MISLFTQAAGFTVAAYASTAREGIEILATHKPDIVLLDLDIRARKGIFILESLYTSSSQAPALGLMASSDHDLLVDAMRAGLRGCLPKDVSFEKVLAGVRSVVSGETMLLPCISEHLLRRIAEIMRDTKPIRSETSLTKRELELLALAAYGCTNREIANAFDLTDGTVKNHLSKILTKLGVRDRTSAVLVALESGYL